MMLYDYAIVGAGASGLQIALAMAGDSFFDSKSILIVEKDEKLTNDKRWSFWERGKGKWDQIIYKKWEVGHVYSEHGHIVFDVEPYTYKMLRAIDFYQSSKQVLSKCKNITWVKDAVSSLTVQDEHVQIVGEENTYLAHHVFDSRIEKSKEIDQSDYTQLLQHFIGWHIKSEEPVFASNEFVMMDFRYAIPGLCSFIYVLPFNDHEALIEYTLFTDKLLPDHSYTEKIEQYISKELSMEKYDLLEVEKGVIPMNTYPYHKASRSKITKIGTAGSWVKPSSGYSFKNTEKYVHKLIENIKNGASPDDDLLSKKHRYYDSLFLNVLATDNAKGPDLFHTMYSKNNIQKVFQFLDEETNLLDDLAIMASFNPLPFLKSLWKNLLKGQ